jgi:hypothetical protein
MFMIRIPSVALAIRMLSATAPPFNDRGCGCALLHPPRMVCGRERAAIPAATSELAECG